VIAAKVAARRRNCDRYRVEWSPPMYIRGDGREHVEPSEATASAAANGSGVLEGVAMSRGEATGRARVVRGLEFIDRLEKGDVLVARGTDPGWTPAFPVLAGLVLETGGALAHGALLSREYGIPAVQVTDAMALIEDGATVRVDGTSGRVTVVETATPAEA
jgi:pyruvate,water dikinase